MSYYYHMPLIDEDELLAARQALGADFERIAGYLQEDGMRSIQQLEHAMTMRNAAALVRPAHTLKGEARQFGAQRLGEIAEEIEKAARRCVEEQSAPICVEGEVALLRSCFSETMAVLLPSGPRQPTVPQGLAAPASLPQRPAAARPAPSSGAPRTFGRRSTA